jgi:ferredoxin-NADP reductase
MFRDFTVIDIVTESSVIKSFYLKRTGNGPLKDFLPGQYIAVRVVPTGMDKPVVRHYTLSDSPGKDYYRITIKREEKGMVSGYFHDELAIGDVVEVSFPTGVFHLLPNSSKPVILLSGGVGITPMLSMVEYLNKYQAYREIYFIHSSLNRAVRPMAERLNELSGQNKNLQVGLFHTSPQSTEQQGIDYDFSGYISKEYLQAVCGQQEVDLFLCGPFSFMESVYRFLLDSGIAETNIHYEFFGEHKQLGTKPDLVSDGKNSFRIRFIKSNIEAVWDGSKQSLLDLAETAGLKPAFSCRVGTCSTCESILVKGSFVYDPEPFMETGENSLLICCAKPTSDLEIDI